jgi:hypothetical protein
VGADGATDAAGGASVGAGEGANAGGWGAAFSAAAGLGAGGVSCVAGGAVPDGAAAGGVAGAGDAAGAAVPAVDGHVGGDGELASAPFWKYAAPGPDEGTPDTAAPFVKYCVAAWLAWSGVGAGDEAASCIIITCHISCCCAASCACCCCNGGAAAEREAAGWATAVGEAANAAMPMASAGARRRMPSQRQPPRHRALRRSVCLARPSGRRPAFGRTSGRATAAG